MGSFEELNVWQRGKELAVFIYKLTREGALVKDYGLRDQLRRAAVSIPSNIAEGDELDTDRQAIKSFRIAKGSAAELFTQALIAHEIGYLSVEHFDHVQEECRAISRMLSRLIRVRLEDGNKETQSRGSRAIGRRKRNPAEGEAIHGRG